MLKSKPQFRQASFYTTISMKYFNLLQHQLTFLKQLLKIKINKDQRDKET
jgi:hypothetical protein